MILCGGLGTRLWPLSRRAAPKPFVRPSGDQSLLQATAIRVADGARFSAPLAICHRDHGAVVAEQFREVGRAARTIVLEPSGRGTAPAVAAAALLLAREDENALLLVQPSDHWIGRTEAFLAAVDQAAPAAAAGGLVTFGLKPDGPETGYGYIKPGESLVTASGCFQVAAFVEKPAPAAAEAMVEDGWLWNSGMFLFSASGYLAALARFQPDVLAACREAVDDGSADDGFFRLEPVGFADSPCVSIDRGVMERADNAVVVPAEIGWRDVGTWQGLWQAETKDAQGNVLRGEVLTGDVTNSYIRADHGLVAALGLSDLVIVVDQDAVLVADKARPGDLSKLVARLPSEERPWGDARVLSSTPEVQVTDIALRPGAQVSTPRPTRTAHWIVVEGRARVTLGQDTLQLEAEQSVTAPGRIERRLENPGATQLRVIEISFGGPADQDGD